jgi:hypothetical protein
VVALENVRPLRWFDSYTHFEATKVFITMGGEAAPECLYVGLVVSHGKPFSPWVPMIATVSRVATNTIPIHVTVDVDFLYI